MPRITIARRSIITTARWARRCGVGPGLVYAHPARRAHAGKFIAAVRSAGYINRGEQRRAHSRTFSPRRSSHLPDSPSSCWPPMRTLSPLAWLTSLLLAAVPAGRASANDGPTGQQIFQQRCASCHGASGEGMKDHYDKPLAGDKSAAQLVPADRRVDAQGRPRYLQGAGRRQGGRLHLRCLLLEKRPASTCRG